MPSSAATPPIDFFVSYTQADRAWAEWIAWQLEDAGYKTLIQAWDFDPGSNFVSAMQGALQKAGRTIAVLSEAYFASGFTEAEWTGAFAAGRQRLLPVRVCDCRPDGLLAAIVYLDLVGADEVAARAKLLAGVERGRRKPPTAPPFPGAAASAPPAFPGVARAPLSGLRRAIIDGGELPEISEAVLHEILAASPRTLSDYRLARIAEWSQPRYALNRRFTRLTLLLDQGQDAQGMRW